jgi:hypothetical protein
VLGVALGAGAVAAHTATRLTGQPLAIGALAAAQLGVPVAAVTVGTQQHLLRPGEGAGLLLGALITIAAAVSSVRRRGRTSRLGGGAVIMTLHVDGVGYDCAGSGDPPLVFVHGWCCDRTCFAPQCPCW